LLFSDEGVRCSVLGTRRVRYFNISKILLVGD